MARHRSPGGRGTYPVPAATSKPSAVTGRHSPDGGASRSVAELLRTASVAVLDRPDPAPVAALPRQWRLPEIEVVWPGRRAAAASAPRRDVPSTAELEALFAGTPEAGPAPAGTVEPRREGRGLAAGTAAIAIVGGALSLIAATVPVDALAGGSGAAALSSAASDPSDDGDDDGKGSAALPPTVDGAEIAASISQAHQQVTDQLEAAEAGLEAARQQAAEQKAAAEKAAAEKAAAEKAAAEKAAAQKAAAVTAQRDCGLNESGLGPVKGFVRTAAQLLGCRYGEPTMIGVASRGGASDHPGGKAVDFMVDRATGDALAACALRNKEALGITYVIWRQRINYGDGWQGMADRGGVTANHYDHVHISFGSGGGATSLRGCG
ncbi:MAG: hypothetical protein L0H84_23820 [Pseudonocardia sp.]|nr:hypothetical protein [Pseudonocardia sp.]